jgi:sporulation protein YabP
MAYEEDYKSPAKPHSLTLDRRAALRISGVEDVGSFDEQAVQLTTTGGRLTIRGNSLHMEKMSLETGEVLINGRVDSLDYEDTPDTRGFFARLFR